MKHDKTSAFTLLEMMLALTLMGVLIGSLTASLGLAYKARTRTDNALGGLIRLQSALDDIQMELEAALPPGEVFAGNMYADVDDESPVASTPYLEWYTNYPIELPDNTVVKGDIRKVQIALTKRDGYANPMLVKRTTTNLLATQTVEPTEQVLCRDVQSMSIYFYDGSDWYETWDGSTTESPLPLLIEINLKRMSNSPDDQKAQAQAVSLKRYYRIISTTAKSDGNAMGGGR